MPPIQTDDRGQLWRSRLEGGGLLFAGGQAGSGVHLQAEDHQVQQDQKPVAWVWVGFGVGFGLGGLGGWGGGVGSMEQNHSTKG